MPRGALAVEAPFAGLFLLRVTVSLPRSIRDLVPYGDLNRYDFAAMRDVVPYGFLLFLVPRVRFQEQI